MSIQLKKSNQFSRVRVINIVFCQGDDYEQLCKDLDPDYDPSGAVGAWLDDDQVIDYLLQWYDSSDDHYQGGEYTADGINTEFLGHIQKIAGYKGFFLFSHNSGLGYAGLSKIVEVIHSYPAER